MVRTRLRIMKLLTENNMGLLFKADSRGAATCIYCSIKGRLASKVQSFFLFGNLFVSSCLLKACPLLKFGKDYVDQVQRHILAGTGLQASDDRNKLRAHGEKIGRGGCAKKVPPSSSMREVFAEYSRKRPMNRSFSSCSI